MTPQERDLITALIQRLRSTPRQPQDRDAAALIAGELADMPDAAYLLVQTVLIQDMSLAEAQRRIAALEQERPAPTSFLGRGPWGQHAPPAAAPAPAPVWTLSPQPVQPMVAPLAAPTASGNFLRQAAATAAGIAGGALLFEGIQSLFGPHYGGALLGGMPMQPGLSETVVNNYYGDSGNDPALGNPTDLATDDPGTPDPGQDDPGSLDPVDDGSSDDGSFDV